MKGLTRFIVFGGLRLGTIGAVLALLSKYMVHWFTFNEALLIQEFLLDNASLLLSIFLIGIPVAYWIWIDFERKYNE